MSQGESSPGALEDEQLSAAIKASLEERDEELAAAKEWDEQLAVAIKASLEEREQPVSAIKTPLEENECKSFTGQGIPPDVILSRKRMYDKRGCSDAGSIQSASTRSGPTSSAVSVNTDQSLISMRESDLIMTPAMALQVLPNIPLAAILLSKHTSCHILPYLYASWAVLPRSRSFACRVLSDVLRFFAIIQNISPHHFPCMIRSPMKNRLRSRQRRRKPRSVHAVAESFFAGPATRLRLRHQTSSTRWSKAEAELYLPLWQVRTHKLSTALSRLYRSRV